MDTAVGQRRVVITIDIGGTKIAGGLVDSAGEVCLSERVDTDAHAGGQRVLARTIALAMGLHDAALAKGLAPVAVGVGTAGTVDPQTGSIVYATATLPGWTGIRVRESVADALGLPAFVDNDGNVMALGEAAFGAGRGCPHLVGLTVGTGIGGGIIVDGRIYHGARGAAGHMGHIVVVHNSRRRCSCGGYGCVEAYAAGPAIVADFVRAAGRRRLAEEFGLDVNALGVREIAGLAAAGQVQAASAIRRGSEYLGTAVASIMNLLNPCMVVIGGGVALAGDFYIDTMRETARSLALGSVRDTPIVPALLGPQANLVGAAQLAWQSFS